MRKLTAAVLCVAMSVSAAAPALAARFSDTAGEKYAWAVNYIDDMSGQGYITGYEDGTFRPDNEVTRLECLALFSRAMGANNEVNKPVLSLAHELYDDLLSGYKLEWGTDEIAYLLYKGVLSKSDLDTYILGDEKNTPMRRYEAAIIITKALGGENKALAETAVENTYSDAELIPTAAVKYVYYVTKEGIMNGMGDGTFSPDSSVSRAQMAVMLARTVDKTNYAFFSAKLMNLEDFNILYKTSDGTEGRLAYSDDTVFRVLGVETQAKIMTTGVQAIFTQSGGTLAAVDALSEIPDETVSGVYSSYATAKGIVTITLTVDGKMQNYECAPDVSFTYDGSPATIRSFNKGDAIELSLTNGKVTSAAGSEMETSLSNAVVEEVIADTDVKLKISSSDADYDGAVLDVDSNVTVVKNNLPADLTQIYPGDTVSLTLQYGVVKRIVARSTTRTVEGTIVSLTIAGLDSSMIARVNGKETTYKIPASVEITINGEQGTLYDFRIGDTVKLTTESNAVTKIAATSTQVTAGSITGAVTGVNASMGLISVTDSNGQQMSISTKNNQTTIISSSGQIKKMSDIEIGQTITVRGTMVTGILIADLILIEAEAPAK